MSRVVRSAESVSRAAGAAVSPVTGAAGAVVSQVAASAKQVVAPVSRAAGAVVSPVAGAAAAVVSPVVASVKPVVAPVSGVVGAVASPVTGALAPVSEVVRSVEPVLAPLTRPVAGLVAPVTGAVGGLVRPVLGSTTPGLTGLLAPVAADLPIVAPVTGVTGPAGREPGAQPARQIKLIHPADPVVPSGGAAVTPLPSGKFVRAAVQPADVARPMASGRDRGAASHRAPASALRTGGPAGIPGHVPPPAPVPPAPSDVGCGGGSPIPPAFLTSGHGPRDFRVFTRAHEVFVPLWRPCEPGTGPG
ncbi:hypothetical protein [Amycolatopsis sp. NPDC021455]|uniref:hypothetical protein n=1 Tax=Amycolatopsis sp. NPDC021455 TaxID=3154901 RepID=UPI0033D056E2